MAVAFYPGMNSARLIILAPCSLFVGAVLQLLLARLLSSKAKGVLAFLCSLPALVSAAVALPLVQNGAAIDYTLPLWDGPTALVFHFDALSALFALMGSGLGAIVLLYSIGYMAGDRSATRFFSTMLVFIGGFVALVSSANLLFFYLCWELIGLCSFSLVGFWYTNPEAVAGARKVLLMTHLAGYGLLVAILLIYHSTGSLLWTDPAVARAFTGGIFVLMLVSLIAKSVQVPLHTWIPFAMAAPTPVSALLHAACYVKAGVYLAARMYSLGALPGNSGAILVWVGTITMLLGVMSAMVQTDLKKMLAFHTVSQIGYMMVGIGIGTPLAIAAGLLHCLNHGFFKGGLFLAAGSVQHGSGAREMNELGGLASRMPTTTAVWIVNAGGIMGVPLMSGFASKWLLYTAALQAGWAIPAFIAWITSLGTVFSFLKATSSVFLGSTTPKTEHAHESPFTMLLGMGFISAGTLVLGIAPQIVVRYVLNPVLLAFGMKDGADVSWFGMASNAGSVSIAGGAVLAAASLVFGGIVWMMASGERRQLVPVAVAGTGSAALSGAGGGVFTGGEPLLGAGQIPADEFSGILHDNWHGLFHWTDVDRVYLAVGRLLTAVSSAVGKIVGLFEKYAVPCMIVLAATIAAAVYMQAPPIAHLPIVPLDVQPANLAVPFFLAAGCSLALLVLLVSVAVQSKWRRHFLLLAAAGVVAIAGLIQVDAVLRLALLEVASLLALVLVWRAASTLGAKLTFLTAIVLSAGSLIASHLLESAGDLRWARALFVTGIVVKLAAVPLFFWLLRLADELPSPVLGLLIAVVDIAVFGEVAIAAQSSPWLLEPASLWLGLGLASSLLGSLLMLSQRSLKRLLVLSTVEDMGFLLLGVSSASAIGFTAAVWGAVVHALAKALLFAALSAPEAAGALDEPRGLAARFHVSGASFLFGMLAMLGVPPLMGFASRWRLYETALAQAPWVLALYVASSMMALIAYVLALTRYWWGPSSDELPKGPEPWLLRVSLVMLVIVLLVGGIWPHGVACLHLDLPNLPAIEPGLWRLP